MTLPTYSNPCEFDHLMLEPVHEMMMTGIRIDKEKLEEFRQLAIDEWKGHQETLNRWAQADVNVDSPKAVAHLLYKKLGLPPRTKKGKPTTDEAAIRSIMAECKGKVDSLKTLSAQRRWMDGYICCYLVLKIRGIRKELSSFLGMHIEKGVLVGEAPFMDDDGRVRGTVSVGGAENNRFTHSKTLWGTGINLATNPKKLRKMYVPDDGMEMAEFDLERGESWVYAHLSEDPELLRIHLDGLDFHAETGAAISSVFSEKPVTVEWIIEHKDDEAYRIRYVAKRSNHAYSYRMGAFKGAEVINSEAEDTKITVTVAETKKIRTLWLQKYFMMETWWREIEETLSKTRTMVTPYGRVHQFHGEWGDDLLKSATSYVPSSTSVDYANRGFFNVFYLYQATGAWGLQVLAQTHDSILVQYKADQRAEAIPSIVEAMTSSLTIKGRTFSIPIDPNHGMSWGDLHAYRPAA